MQPLFETDLNKPEVYFWSRTIAFSTFNTFNVWCVAFQYPACSKSFKARSGQQFGEWWGGQGGDRVGSKKQTNQQNKQTKKQLQNKRQKAEEFDLYKVCLSH